MRLHMVVAAGCIAASLVAFELAHTEPDVASSDAASDAAFAALLAVYALVHIVVGLFGPRFWSLALPYAGFLASLPFDDDATYFPSDSELMFWYGFFGMIIVGAAMVGRGLFEAARQPQ